MIINLLIADVVKLADTLDLGSSAVRRGVQVPPSAPLLRKNYGGNRIKK